MEGINLFSHIWKSLVRIFAGFGLACVLGVPLGLLMGLYPVIYSRTRAIIEPIRFIPPIAWIPLAIVLLVGFQRYAFLIWLGAFFPIFMLGAVFGKVMDDTLLAKGISHTSR